MACVDCTNSINDTPQGTSGDDGANAYLYVAYANDITGSGFSMSDATKCFKALKNTTTPLINPQQSDFNDLWFDTCGTNGSNGNNGKNADGTNLVSTVGLVDTYQIVNEDNVPIGNFTVTNGADGADGTDAIVDLGTVSTGAAGSSVIITNTGPTPNNAIFNFTIPRGNTGSQGPKGDAGNNGNNASMTVEETDGNPSGSGITTVRFTNTSLPPVLDINTNIATLDFNIPFSNLVSVDAGSHKIYYPQSTTGITVGANFLNATSPDDDTNTCWYASIGNTNIEQARRIKIKNYNDGAISIIGVIQKKMKAAITTYNMQLNTDVLKTSQIFFTNYVLFDYTFTGLAPTFNLCQIFPVTIFIHNDSTFDNGTTPPYATNIFGVYQGTAALCGTLLQITGYENITELNNAIQYYMTININHTFGNPKVSGTTYL